MTSPMSSPEALSQMHLVSISDLRVDESSGLACSATHPSLIYTINDEDGPVFVIDARTGRTVGAFSVAGRKLRDPEALSMGLDGVLWIADIGESRGTKKAFALYALAEPGPGDHGALPAARYRIVYPDGLRPDAEAFLVHPATGDGYIITRQSPGKLYRFRHGGLDSDSKNVLEPVDVEAPPQVTDGCFTIDGRFVLVRQKGRRDTVTVLDAGSWRVIDEFRVPRLQQPESIAADPDGKHAWIGSEGRNSPLIRMPLPAAYAAGS